jgi:nicotinate-nucleotide adenylyltransferase
MDLVMNSAVLGGTFDPVHLGHLMLAGVVRQYLAPAEIIFMPAARPWMKEHIAISSAEDRLEMVKLATCGREGFSVSTIEIERGGPTYTVDTLRELRGRLPEGRELYFILGWDNLLELPRWREPEALIRLCKLVAVPRIGRRVPDAAMLEKLLPGLSSRVILLAKPEIDISASVIRERVRRGESIRHLVPDAVAGYIEQRGLYRSVA